MQELQQLKIEIIASFNMLSLKILAPKRNYVSLKIKNEYKLKPGVDYQHYGGRDYRIVND